MKVILLDEIKGKGGEGDVVEVAQGYAENFLFPKKLAVAATKGNLKQLDERRNNIAKREAVRLATANETKAAFEGKTVTVDVKVGDEGILFGSVTAAMVADAIKAQLGMDIDRKRVELGKPIKVAGAHTVAISLYREIKAEVVVLVGVTAEELAAEAEVEEAAEVAEAETAEQLAVLLLFLLRHAPGKTAALAAAGGEMADMLFAAAPRPLLICGQRDDFFDPRGTLECYDELRRVYRILGCENEVESFIGPLGHGLSPHLRERVVDFFCRHAGQEKGDLSAVAPFPEKELWCTPTGNVCDLPENRRIQLFIRERAEEQIRNRTSLPAPELAQKLRSSLKIGAVAMPDYRVLRPRPAAEQVLFSRFLLETEPGMRVTLSYVDRRAWFHLPEREKGAIPLYLPHQSAFDELSSGGEPGFALDYRGVGETMPDGCDQGKRDFFGPYQFDYHFASLGLLLEEPYLGGRVRDIMAACLLLNPEGEGRIALTARGVGVVPGVIAALLSDRVAELRLLDRPESLAEVVQAESTPFPQSNMFPGMLAVTDLPDLYRALREKGVRLSGD